MQQRADRAMAILNETAISQAKCKAGSQTLCMDDINGSCGDNGKEVKLVCVCGKTSDLYQENTVLNAYLLRENLNHHTTALLAGK